MPSSMSEALPEFARASTGVGAAHVRRAVFVDHGATGLTMDRTASEEEREENPEDTSSVQACASLAG